MGRARRALRTVQGLWEGNRIKGGKKGRQAGPQPAGLKGRAGCRERWGGACGRAGGGKGTHEEGTDTSVGSCPGTPCWRDCKRREAYEGGVQGPWPGGRVDKEKRRAACSAERRSPCWPSSAAEDRDSDELMVSAHRARIRQQRSRTLGLQVVPFSQGVNQFKRQAVCTRNNSKDDPR